MRLLPVTILCSLLHAVNTETIHLCGTQVDSEVWCVGFDNGTFNDNWTKSNLLAKRIAIDGNVMTLSNAKNELHFTNINDNNFVQRKHLRHISVNNGVLCGVNDQDGAGLIFCADDYYTKQNPTWHVLNFQPEYPMLKLFALSGMKTNLKQYYIPIEGSIYSQVAAADEATKLLIQFSYDGSTLCGVTASKAAYCATEGLPTHPVFVQLLGNDHEYIAVQSDRIFAIRANQGVHHTSNPASIWTYMHADLITMDASYSE